VAALLGGNLGLTAANANAPDEVATVLLKTLRCKRIEVQMDPIDLARSQFSRIAIKLEGARLGGLNADTMTVVYTNPEFSLDEMRQTGKFRARCPAGPKVGILISVASLKDYFDYLGVKYHKKYNKLSVKFSPPYIESEFDIPSTEFSKFVRTLLTKYMRQNTVGGYASVKISARENKVFCSPEKTIIHHFLIPNGVAQQLEKRLNPVFIVPVLDPFSYTIDHATVQNNYLYLGN